MDAPLRELVSFLHCKKIKTTASCSGHFRSIESLEKIFFSLKKDEKAIKCNGLQMQHIEYGHCIIYKDKNYSLPFSKIEFTEKVSMIQQKGILGIRCGTDQRLKKFLLKMNSERVKIEKRKDIVFINTCADNMKENDKIWQKITSEIKNIYYG